MKEDIEGKLEELQDYRYLVQDYSDKIEAELEKN